MPRTGAQTVSGVFALICLGLAVIAAVWAAIAFVGAHVTTADESKFTPTDAREHQIAARYPDDVRTLLSALYGIKRIVWADPRHIRESTSIFGTVKPRLGRLDDSGGGLVRVVLEPLDTQSSKLTIETASRFTPFEDTGLAGSVSNDIRSALATSGFTELHHWHSTTT